MHTLSYWEAYIIMHLNENMVCAISMEIYGINNTAHSTD